MEAGEPLSSPEFGGDACLNFKTIFGDRLQTRQIDNQFKELTIKSATLDQVTRLGMSDSIRVVG